MNKPYELADGYDICCCGHTLLQHAIHKPNECHFCDCPKFELPKSESTALDNMAEDMFAQVAAIMRRRHEYENGN